MWNILNIIHKQKKQVFLVWNEFIFQKKKLKKKYQIRGKRGKEKNVEKEIQLAQLFPLQRTSRTDRLI